MEWGDAGTAVLVAAIALIVMLAVIVTSDRRAYGTVIRALAILSFVGTIPLALDHMGGSTGWDRESMKMISILGTIGSAMTGVFHFVKSRRRRQAEAGGELQAAAAAEGAATQVEPAQAGSTFAPSEGASTGAMAAAGAGSGSTLDPGGEETVVAPGPAPQGAPPTQEAPPPAWLVFKSGPNAGQTIPIAGGVTNIGRAPDSDVVVDDPGVSREHAQITFVGGEYQLSDAGSSGGTLVEGQAAQATVPLASGTAVNVGQTELVFMQGQDQPTAAPAATGTPAAAPGRAAETMVGQAPKETLMAWLAVTAGPAKGATCQINVGETTIGRAEDNDLRIEDAAVSRQHAVVVADENGMTILDLGSSTGTKANGQAIGGRPVSTTSVVAVGDTELMLVAVEQVEGAAPTAGAADATMVGGAPGTGGAGVLVARKGPDAGKTYQLVEGDNVIGREDASVILTDPTISRRHAIIRKTGDTHTIYDLGSRAGTVVDGEKLEGVRIEGGSVVNVGRSEIVVMQPSAG